MAVVITEECISCGACADACPVSAITECGDKYSIGEDCTECMACVSACPVNAIVNN